MDVIVESKTLQVTQALRDMATRHARKLSHVGGRILRVRVSLEAITRKKNDSQAAVAQYVVELPGKDIVVRRRARDLYLAITEAANHATVCVKKMKEKRLTQKRQRLELQNLDFAT